MSTKEKTAAAKQGTFGARVYFFTDGKVLIKQTRNDGRGKIHRIDMRGGYQHERHLKFNARGIYEAMKLARDGKLTEK